MVLQFASVHKIAFARTGEGGWETGGGAIIFELLS